MGFGNAFAGRGMSLNDAIESLRPLFENLRPVSHVLADPVDPARRFIAALARHGRDRRPRLRRAGQFFTNAAIAFAAISSDPEALKETISEGPPTLETAIETLPRQRPFLAELAELSRRLRPGVQELRARAAGAEQRDRGRHAGAGAHAADEPRAAEDPGRAAQAGRPADDEPR